MKLERHSKIVELIGKYEIETQEELAEHLKQAGYKVTQATVSRDIRELKLSDIDWQACTLTIIQNKAKEPCRTRPPSVISISVF